MIDVTPGKDVSAKAVVEVIRKASRSRFIA